MKMLNQNFQNTLNSGTIKPETNGLFWHLKDLLKLDDIAVEILQLVDGERDVE